MMFSLPVLAATQDLDDRAVQLDQNVQALKDEVLEFNKEASKAEVDAVLPDYLRLNVYLSVEAPGLLLDKVTVSLDDQTPETYHYDAFDSRAILTKGSTQRLLRVAAQPGPHKLHISFSGKYADAKPDSPPITDQYSTTIDKSAQTTDVEFMIARQSRFGGKPRLSMKQWRPAQ
ncbi:hypothetical protein [Solimonas marina]|uniref:AraC family transcriptional regulator n=1 Tax=Solimonas marina TaxID=2714601 RepID=A0A969WD23_9GAMM|nr:hypothetical protein [Solimonas marina]NKF23778.1 hypothetical protein [Solimonas marina]